MPSPTAPPSPPRSIPRGTPGFVASNALLLAGLGTTLTCLPLTIVFLAVGGPFWRDCSLDKRSVTTEAEVVSIELPEHDHEGTSPGTIRARFRDAANREHLMEGRSDDGAQFERARRGRVLVEYDPDDPEIHRLQGGSASLFGRIALLPMSFTLVGLLLTPLGLVLRLRRRAIYRHGTAVLATVVRSARLDTDASRPMVSVRYRFTVGDRTIETVGTAAESAIADQTLWVLYDPKRPERNLVV